MKLLVKNTFIEHVSSSSSRCSDGYYRDSTITKSLNVYSDSDKIPVSAAEIITEFIDKHTHYDSDRVWDWSYEGVSKENVDLKLTEELINLLNAPHIGPPAVSGDCNIVLNSIASKISENHKSIISDLKKEQSIIHKKFLVETEKCNARMAMKAFYKNESHYPINEKMPDFNEFPLDIARLNDNVEFFEYLLSKKANSVANPHLYAEWLCKKGKFEYLNLFVDLSKLKLSRFGSTFGDRLLYYTIACDRLDLLEKFGKALFDKDTNEIYSDKSISIVQKMGQIAVKHSKLETIKELFNKNKYSFYENIAKCSMSIQLVLDINCFRDIETASFFVENAMVDSIFAMLYWDKNELLCEFLSLEKYSFNEIYLTSLRDFFISKYNLIIEALASVNSFSLIKPPLNDVDFQHVPHCYQKNWRSTYFSVYSVLENCLIQKNFILFSKLFSICTTKEEVESYDACRLLFMVYKYDEKQETKDITKEITKFIQYNDLRMLLGVACLYDNINLLTFLISQVHDINETIEVEPSFFGLEKNYSILEKMSQLYRGGTILHLFLATHSNMPSGRVT